MANEFFKAVVDEALAVEQLTVDVLAKSWAKVFADLFVVGQEIPVLIEKVSGIGAEAELLLSDPAAQKDLLDYVASKKAVLPGQAQDVVMAISQAALHLAQDTVAIIAAFEGKGPVASSVAPAVVPEQPQV